MTNFNKFEDYKNDFNSKTFNLFKIDTEELLTNKFQLSNQETGYNDIIIDSWWYWQYEFNVKKLNEKNKDEKKEQESQNSQQGDMMGKMGSYNPSKMMKQYSPSNFKSSVPRF